MQRTRTRLETFRTRGWTALSDPPSWKLLSVDKHPRVSSDESFIIVGQDVRGKLRGRLLPRRDFSAKVETVERYENWIRGDSNFNDSAKGDTSRLPKLRGFRGGLNVTNRETCAIRAKFRSVEARRNCVCSAKLARGNFSELSLLEKHVPLPVIWRERRLPCHGLVARVNADLSANYELSSPLKFRQLGELLAAHAPRASIRCNSPPLSACKRVTCYYLSPRLPLALRFNEKLIATRIISRLNCNVET